MSARGRALARAAALAGQQASETVGGQAIMRSNDRYNSRYNSLYRLLTLLPFFSHQTDTLAHSVMSPARHPDTATSGVHARPVARYVYAFCQPNLPGISPYASYRIVGVRQT